MIDFGILAGSFLLGICVGICVSIALASCLHRFDPLAPIENDRGGGKRQMNEGLNAPPPPQPSFRVLHQFDFEMSEVPPGQRPSDAVVVNLVPPKQDPGAMHQPCGSPPR